MGEWFENLPGIIQIVIGIPLAIIILILGLVFWFRPVAAVLFGFPMGCLLAYILMSIIDIEIYRKYSQKYAENIKIKNKSIEDANNIIKIKNVNKINALIKELDVVKNEISRAEQILCKYYDKDIIYRKYRNFVAISSFYEYFESGRCSTLTGHEGAYNIYETEIRQNIIISQLSEVINHLKRIEENQYMIYSAIIEANETMKSFSAQINSSLDTIGYGIDSLNGIAKITEYNTRITAQNTEFIKWLNIFEIESSRSNWV